MSVIAVYEKIFAWLILFYIIFLAINFIFFIMIIKIKGIKLKIKKTKKDSPFTINSLFWHRKLRIILFLLLLLDYLIIVVLTIGNISNVIGIVILLLPILSLMIIYISLERVRHRATKIITTPKLDYLYEINNEK